MRIGILTFHRSRNCGAMLQAYALKTVLERMGHKVMFPACNQCHYDRWLPIFKPGLTGIKRIRSIAYRCLYNIMSLGYNRDAPRLYKAFADRYFQEINCAIEDFPSYFDCIIVGSDQVWSPEIAGLRMTLLMGVGIPDILPIISYAASCGDQIPSNSSFKRLGVYLRRFSKVSVREEFLRTYLKEEWGIQSVVDVDPSLLLSFEDYITIATYDLVPQEPYILVFSVWDSPFIRSLVEYLGRKAGKRIVFALGESKSRLGAPAGLTIGVSPDRLLGLMARADGIVAESFHGAALSVLTHKPFVVVGSSRLGTNSRVLSLLELLGLSERYVSPEIGVKTVLELLEKPVNDTVFAKLGALRGESMARLSKLDNIILDEKSFVS